MATKVDINDPNVKRLVYNMYRGMLGGYNDKANVIIGTLPKSAVTEDQGIQRQIESMMRQSSQLSGGSPSPGVPAQQDGSPVNAPPPCFPAPPPPPPPVPGALGLPTTRLNTEIADTRGRVKEPPAAIQNAMMKDKKPFTYTPGGLDLSQIRSPRMARRIERNAAAEGVAPSVVSSGVPSVAAAAPSHTLTPQMAVSVFPPPPPPPPPPANGGGGGHVQGAVIGGGVGGHPQLVIPKNPVLRPTGLRHDKAEQETYVAPQQQYQPVQQQPQQPVQQPQPQMFVQRQPSEKQQGAIFTKQRQQINNTPPTQCSSPPPPPRAQLGSLYIPPVNTAGADTTSSPTPPTLNKAPTPWMSQQKATPAVPAWAARDEQPQGARIIPIQIEGREPPQAPRQQQQSPQYQQQQHQPSPPYQQAPAGTRIIPIQVEGAAPQQQQPQHRGQRQMQPVYVHNKFSPATPTSPAAQSPSYQQTQDSSDPRQLQQQQSWSGAPIQSRSFRVLQKMTDTNQDEEDDVDNTGVPQEHPAPQPSHWVQPGGPQQQQYKQQQGPGVQWGGTQQDYSGPQWGPQNTQGVPVSQLRKLQMNDDDRALMNKFKAQVSENNPANEEENPRYRGGHIPSRVFRMLDQSVPRGSTTGVQQRPQQNQVDAPSGPYIPASQQQVQEPRKYTGGAIPSRSFRMLQAMTAPENCGADQSDM